MKQIRFDALAIGLVLFILIGLSACGDDGIPDPIPERDRAEQQAADLDSLQNYLQTHYYNSGDFVGVMNPNIADLEVTELEDGETLPDGHTLLIDAVETKTTQFLDVDYEYYILSLNTGGGEGSPRFCDQVRVNFRGYLLDGSIFDSSTNSVIFDLVTLVPGWGRVLPEFNVATDFLLNNDGTVTFNDAGVGAMFLPSGLGFYSSGSTVVLPYSNIWFTFELFQTQENDHDGDGLPSYFEDLDENLSVGDDDTDENGLANFVDPDDDGDGVATRDELETITYEVIIGVGDEPVLAEGEFEISRSEDMGILTIITVKVVDSNNDGLGDYLDDTIDINYTEEDED